LKKVPVELEAAWTRKATPTRITTSLTGHPAPAASNLPPSRGASRGLRAASINAAASPIPAAETQMAYRYGAGDSAGAPEAAAKSGGNSPPKRLPANPPRASSDQRNENAWLRSGYVVSAIMNGLPLTNQRHKARDESAPTAISQPVLRFSGTISAVGRAAVSMAEPARPVTKAPFIPERLPIAPAGSAKTAIAALPAPLKIPMTSV